MTEHTIATNTGVAMPERVIPWGTVISGALALAAALITALTQVAGVEIPVRSAGPAGVIVVGLLIVAAGIFVVLRSSRSSRSNHGVLAAPATAPTAPVAVDAGPVPATSSASGPLDGSATTDELPLVTRTTDETPR